MNKFAPALVLLSPMLSGCFVKYDFNIESDPRFQLLFHTSANELMVYKSTQMLNKNEFLKELSVLNETNIKINILSQKYLKILRPIVRRKEEFDEFVGKFSEENNSAPISKKLKYALEVGSDSFIEYKYDTVKSVIDEIENIYSKDFGVRLSNRSRGVLSLIALQCSKISFRYIAGMKLDPNHSLNESQKGDFEDANNCFKAIAEALEIEAVINDLTPLKNYMSQESKIVFIGSSSRNADGKNYVGNNRGFISAEFSLYKYNYKGEIGIITNKDGYIGQFYDYGDDLYAVRTAETERKDKDGSKIPACSIIIDRSYCSNNTLKKSEFLPEYFSNYSTAVFYLSGLKSAPPIPKIYYFPVSNRWATWEDIFRRGRSSFDAASEIAKDKTKQATEAAKSTSADTYKAIKTEIKEEAKSLLPWPFR